MRAYFIFYANLVLIYRNIIFVYTYGHYTRHLNYGNDEQRKSAKNDYLVTVITSRAHSNDVVAYIRLHQCVD